VKALLGSALAAIALALIPLAAPAAPDDNSAPYGAPWRTQEIDGTVANFRPYNADLFGGRHLVLHNGTVIRPTGITLQRGMHVRVFGRWNRDGSFRADEVDVVPRRWRERDGD